MRQAIAVQNLNMINRHSRNEISGCVFLPDMQFRIRVKGGQCLIPFVLFAFCWEWFRIFP